MVRKKNGDEEELSPEQKVQHDRERAAAREGYDVRDNILFLKEYGADDKYCGMIFAYAVIKSRDHRISEFPEDVHQKAAEQRLSRFQKSVRNYLSNVKVRLRFAEAKNTTVNDILAEFDSIDFKTQLRKTAITHEGRKRGIENVLYDMVQKEVSFDMIANAVFEGANNYRKKKSPVEFFYIEARCIQDALENRLALYAGGRDE